jgi:hypothetical protein
MVPHGLFSINISSMKIQFFFFAKRDKFFKSMIRWYTINGSPLTIFHRYFINENSVFFFTKKDKFFKSMMRSYTINGSPWTFFHQYFINVTLKIHWNFTDWGPAAKAQFKANQVDGTLKYRIGLSCCIKNIDIEDLIHDKWITNGVSLYYLCCFQMQTTSYIICISDHSCLSACKKLAQNYWEYSRKLLK